MARRPLLIGLLALLVAALVVGALAIGMPAPPTGSVPSSTTTPAPSPIPTPTPAPFVLQQRVYFGRDELPPVGVVIPTGSQTQVPASEGGPLMAAARAKMRLDALVTATAPSGLTNGFTTLRTKPTVREVKVEGDLITVDYTVPNGDWGIAGASASGSFIEQLVYTATEEPGITRVLVTMNGGQQATIDQAIFDEPRTRDDVAGYPFSGTKAGPIEYPGDSDVLVDVVDWRGSAEDVTPGMGRFVVELRPRGNAPTAFWSPKFTAKLEPNTASTPSDTHKWLLRVELAEAVWSAAQGEAFHCCPLKSVDKTPIRTVSAYPLNAGQSRGVGFGIGLDDARPWRVTMLQSPLRMVVDIGGHPYAVSESVAVYSPKRFETVTSTFTVSGLARTFEANVQWRLKSGTRVIAQGHTTASVGTSALWGGYSFQVRVPSGSGENVTLEVFWGSPKDGSDQGLVAIPLRIR